MPTNQGKPGLGKSQILLLLGKPRWCPAFLYKPYAQLTGKVVVYAVTKLDPSDMPMPTIHEHIHTIPKLRRLDDEGDE